MTVYLFEDFRFDEKGETLARGAVDIAIRPQTAQLLALLIAKRGGPVSKDEMAASVWGDEFVNDQAIFQSINQLRKALDENARKPRFLKTVPRKGYQWICDVTIEGVDASIPQRINEHAPVDSDSSAPIESTAVETQVLPSRKPKKVKYLRWMVGSSVLLFILATFYFQGSEKTKIKNIQNVAVARLAFLPFSNETGDPEKQWIELGLMDMVARTFSLNRDVNAIGVERVLKAYRDNLLERGQPLTSAQLERLKTALGADWVISASIKNQAGAFQLAYKAYGGEQSIKSDTLESATMSELAHSLESQINNLLEKGMLRSKYEVFSKDPFVNESYAMGLQLHFKSEFSRAMPYFEVCLHKDPDFLWAGYRLARAKGNIADLNASASLAESLLEKARVKHDQPLIAEFLGLLGDVALGRDDLKGQLRYYKEALELWRNLGDGEKEITLMLDLAMAYGDEGKKGEASRLFKKARELAENSGDQYRQAMVADMRGILELDNGNYQAARDRMEFAYAMWRDLSAWEEASFSLISIGQLSQEQGDWNHAASVLTEALKIAEDHGLKTVSAEALNILGSVARDSEKFVESAAYFQEALTIAESLEDYGLESMILLELAELKSISNKKVEARDFAERALNLTQEIGYVLVESDIRLFLAELDMEVRDFDTAKEHVQTAMSLSSNYPEPYLILARILAAEKDCEAVISTLERMKEKWPEYGGDTMAELEGNCGKH